MQLSLLNTGAVIALALLGLTSCKTSEESSEASAGIMLDEARKLLAEGHYAAARDTILSLRAAHPTALQTRSEAIVTLDSVELLETRDSIARYEQELQAVRETFKQMEPRINGHTNEAYYTQQRRLRDMEFHLDELCAKVKFYIRKIDLDNHSNTQ